MTTISTAVTLNANTTITDVLTFTSGGSYTTNGYTLTINGPLIAGAQQIFVTSGSQVVFGPNATQYVLLEWFGAVGDGSTSDTTAIQLALDRATAARLPVVPQPNKTYRCNAVTFPQYGVLKGSGTCRRPGAVFKSNSTGALFTLPSNVDDHMGVIEGVQLDGNSTASSLIYINDCNPFFIRNCGFKNATRAIDIDAGIEIFIDNCEFTGTFTHVIRLTGLANGIYIRECNIDAAATYDIYTDSSYTGDTLTITDTTIGGSGKTAIIKLDRSSSAPGQRTAKFFGVRVDCGASVAHVDIGRYALGVSLTACSFVDAAPYNIKTDAGYTFIENNYFSDATTAAVALTTNSNFCRVGPNVLNNASTIVVDTSTYNGGITGNAIIRPIRKGATGDRGNAVTGGFTSTEYGAVFLDTTLDADGLPIFWQGTKWIKADGSNA